MKHSDPRSEEGRKKLAEDATEGAKQAWKRASELAAEHGPTVQKAALQTAERAQAIAIEHAPKAKALAGNLASKTMDSAKTLTNMCAPTVKDVALRALGLNLSPLLLSVKDVAMARISDFRSAGSSFAWRIVYGMLACVFFYGFGASLPGAIALYMKRDDDEQPDHKGGDKQIQKHAGVDAAGSGAALWASISSLWPLGSADGSEDRKRKQNQQQETEQRQRHEEQQQKQEQRSWWGYISGEPESAPQRKGFWEQAKQLVGEAEPEPQPRGWWEQLVGTKKP
jgi:hypothetical protein